MSVLGVCCEKMVVLGDGVGVDRGFDCKAFMEGKQPHPRARAHGGAIYLGPYLGSPSETEDLKLSICKQLRETGALCPEIEKLCPGFREEGKDRQWSNCKEAADALNEEGFYAGEADLKLTPNVGAPTYNQQADGKWTGTVSVTYTLDPGSTIVTLPNWSWPNMSPAEEEALNRFRDRVRVHEEGHLTVASRVAKEFSGEIGPVTGESREEVEGNLNTALAEHHEAGQKKLEEQAGTNGAYDVATDRGRKQSAGPDHGFPGGEDVVFTCP